MATREEIQEQVVATLHGTFGLAIDQLVPTARLVQDLHLDSIDAIDLAVQIEDRLGVAPKGDDLRKLLTIQDVIDFIHGQPPVGAALASEQPVKPPGDQPA